MVTVLKKSVFLMIMVLIFSFTGFGDEEREMMEPVIIDTVTAIGGEAGELEINVSGIYEWESNLLRLPLEIEYSFWDNFGFELELPFVSTGSDAGIGDIELACQWTCLKREFNGGRWLSALGMEIGFPTGDDHRNLGEGAWEIEPFVFFPLEINRLLIQPKLGLGIEVYKKEKTGEKEIAFNYSLALLYRLQDRFIIGFEFIGEAGEETTLSIAPELIVGIGENINIGAAGEYIFKPLQAFRLFVRVEVEFF